MTRQAYLRQVIRCYLGAPDTPDRARKSDWAVATTFYQREIPLADVEHAIRLATLRRACREPGLGPHQPIYSLAYFRSLVNHLQQQPHDLEYVGYVAWRYRDWDEDR